MLLLILIFICSFSFNSCNRDSCFNTNQILQNNAPNSIKYKSELSKILKNSNQSRFTFWFKEYIQNENNEVMLVNVQGNGICAVMEIDIKKWDKLQQLRTVKGKGYSGAEFKNLQFDIQEDSTNIRFVFKDLDQIVD